MPADPGAFLTQYYLNEFIPSLPRTLQEIGLDKATWISGSPQGEITTITEFDFGNYSLLPWRLQTLFDLPDGAIQTSGKAWFFLLAYYTILDHVIDGKVASTPAMTLFLNHLHLEAQTQFRRIPCHSEQFWTRYDNNSRFCLVAMMQENSYVIDHDAPYTYARMQAIHQQKSGIIRLLVHALVEVSDKQEYEIPLCRIFEHYAIATQLLDDVMDWEKDLEHGHYKLPFVMALESENIPFDAAREYDSATTISQLFIKHDIPVQICKMALGLLEAAKEVATALPGDHDLIPGMLDHYIQITEKALKGWRAWRSVSRFVSNFDA